MASVRAVAKRLSEMATELDAVAMAAVRDLYEVLGVARDASRRGHQEGLPARSRASTTPT